jgi:hypothetical protein
MNKKELTKVEMSTFSILGIVEEYRYEATYTTHELSKSVPGEITPCSDNDVALFVSEIKSKSDTAILIVSNIEWAEYGNCVNDELFDVTLTAIRLPDDRYYLELNGFGIHEEYIYQLHE